MLLHSPTHICFISTKYLGSRRRWGGDKKGKGRRAEEGLGSRVEGRRRREMEAICRRNEEVRGEEV